MGLEFRKGTNGDLRRKWYAGIRVNGKRTSINLGVKIMGKPPASLSLKDRGDAAFERSRAKAYAKLQQVLAETRDSRDAARTAERVFELKTGEKLRSVRLEDLPEEWAAIPRRRPPVEQYAVHCRRKLEQFVSFVRKRNPKATEIVHVNRDMARAFMEAEEARGITNQTWNATLKLLRTTFKHLMPAGMTNPFATIPTRETAPVSRKPFSPEELNAILQAAEGDDFVRPILVTAICTAMRKGDCCKLCWEDVDLAQRFITVKTSKTGQTVDIPSFPMLHAELSARRPSAKGAKGYVFPEQAKMYEERPHNITRRVRKVLEAAGFGDGDASRGEIHATREKGLRKASVRDFHSFRTTFITVALTAGIPMELVRQITGHATDNIVRKHYFRPDREASRQALEAAMPGLLLNGAVSPRDRALAILDGMAAETWEADRDHLRELIAQIG